MANQMTMPTLVKERRTKYVEALRSGDYTQCRNAYTKHGNFCAVGLAMDMTHESVDIEDETIEDMLCNTAEDFYLCPYHINNLITMNDEYEMSFNQIADKLVDMGFLTDVDYQRLPSTATEE